MIEKNDLFDYGLKIYQNTDYFKFSLDSILLAEFVKFSNNSAILDICTGFAPIPLILSQKGKNMNISIEAVEIQKEVYDLALKSVKENNLEEKIKIYNADIKKFQNAKKYDIITCNPPYFKVTSHSLLNENEIKAKARHEICLNLDDLVNCVVEKIRDNGTFYMVHRSERLIEVINTLSKNNFGIRRICFVNTKNDDKADFFLIEAARHKKSDVKIMNISVWNRKTYQGIFDK